MADQHHRYRHKSNITYICTGITFIILALAVQIVHITDNSIFAGLSLPATWTFPSEIDFSYYGTPYSLRHAAYSVQSEHITLWTVF